MELSNLPEDRRNTVLGTGFVVVSIRSIALEALSMPRERGERGERGEREKREREEREREEREKPPTALLPPIIRAAPSSPSCKNL